MLGEDEFLYNEGDIMKDIHFCFKGYAAYVVKIFDNIIFSVI